MDAMNTLDLSALEDVTPYFGQRIELIDGKKVCFPVATPDQGPLLQHDEDGTYQDAAGVWWTTGWIGARHCKRRVE